MYQVFQLKSSNDIISYIENQIKTFELFLTNEEGYKKLRKYYNQEKNSLDLFILVAFSFNHQIRFNNSHEFNNPFGRDRSSFNANMKANLIKFIDRIQQISIDFSSKSFEDFDFSILNENDFVYADPPYLITTGTYNDGKRGFTGWSEKEEYKLLEILDNLHQKNIKFALSNVLEHKGKSNDILKNWTENNPNYKINYIDFNYSNANYQTLNRDKNASIEVLITNYVPENISKKSLQQTLF